MTTKDRIFLESKAWAQEKLSLDPDYFMKLNGMHTPNMLWIGSSDSLMSVREITNTEPGEILVYRNIASQVRADDLSLMAMIEDAVEVEHIECIVVCGYSHCSGIRDVLVGADDRPAVRDWLQNIRRLRDENQGDLEGLDFREKEKRLGELNIELQIRNLSGLPCIQKAWKENDRPVLYGWYFDLYEGSLKEIFSMTENDNLKKLSPPSVRRIFK